MRVYLASGNRHKLGEFRTLLPSAVLQLYSAAELPGGMPVVEESAQDFLGNARLKARSLLPQAPEGAWVLADDSGLEVAALGGAPGVHSARYSGPLATDQTNNSKLLAALSGVSAPQRLARFTCCLVLVSHAQEYVATGHCNGSILKHPEGDTGFGYDPLFQPDGHAQSFAALGSTLKQQISHRAAACQALLKALHKAG